VSVAKLRLGVRKQASSFHKSRLAGTEKSRSVNYGPFVELSSGKQASRRQSGRSYRIPNYRRKSRQNLPFASFYVNNILSEAA
jgi:hypothetical protein